MTDVVERAEAWMRDVHRGSAAEIIPDLLDELGRLRFERLEQADEARHWRERHTRESARAMWPVLSARLRQLHERWNRGDRVVCLHCSDHTEPVRLSSWPCATVRELDRIDKELGL